MLAGTPNFIQCSNRKCRKYFSIYSDTHSVLEVHLDAAMGVYDYCSKKCLETALADMNENNTPFDLQPYIDKSEILSESNPFKMRVYLKIKDLKVTLL